MQNQTVGLNFHANSQFKLSEIIVHLTTKTDCVILMGEPDLSIPHTFVSLRCLVLIHCLISVYHYRSMRNWYKCIVTIMTKDKKIENDKICTYVQKVDRLTNSLLDSVKYLIKEHLNYHSSFTIDQIKKLLNFQLKSMQELQRKDESVTSDDEFIEDICALLKGQLLFVSLGMILNKKLAEEKKQEVFENIFDDPETGSTNASIH